MTATSRIPAVEIAFRTDPGRDPDKQVNEDTAAHVETSLGLLAVVCDGMGGHAGGKEASELATKTITELVSAAPEGSPPGPTLKSAIEEANRRVHAMPTAEHGFRPGSTVVALLAHDGGAEIAHVGDSRIYLVHSGAVAQITRDHSMVQEMVDRNLIRAEDAAKHPDANKILRALGIAPEAEVDLKPETIAYVAGDVFVLCSDGLSDLVGPAEILEVAGSKPPAQAAGQLVDLANARGGHDNITVMVLRMKVSAVVSGDARTIVKTMQLTQHLEAPPREQGSGPRGTVVEAPLHAGNPHLSGLNVAPAPVVGGPPPPVAAPPAMSGGAPAVSMGAPPAMPAPGAPMRPSEPGERRSVAPLLIGVVLSLVALAIIGGIVWVTTIAKGHVTVPIVEGGGPVDAGLVVEEDAAPAEIPVAPTLTPSASTSARWFRREDGGPPRPPELADCDRARGAKAKGAPANVVSHLEEKCRAAGGTP